MPSAGVVYQTFASEYPKADSFKGLWFVVYARRRTSPQQAGFTATHPAVIGKHLGTRVRFDVRRRRLRRPSWFGAKGHSRLNRRDNLRRHSIQ